MGLANLRYKHVTSGTTTIGGSGSETELTTVNVNTAAASSTVTIYDSVQDTPHVVAVIDSSIVQSKGYGVRCPGGIIVVIAGGSPDVTIGYV